MRNIPPEFLAHLNGQVTTICRCWKIVRRDGHVLGFTEHDQELYFGSYVFQPMSGLNSTVAESSLGLTSDSVEVLGALTSHKLRREDIRSSKYDGARIEIFVVNWSNPEENLLENVYRIGEIIEEDGLFKAELRTLEHELDQTRGEHFIRQCQADLGDYRCKINLDDRFYRGDGFVTSHDGLRQVSTGGLESFSSQWFESGLLTWTTGENASSSMEISQHLNNGSEVILQMWKIPDNPLSVGDKFNIVAGCNKKFSTCKHKFSNALNFRGFPHMPGNDFALSYPDNSENLDGSPIVR